MSNTLLSFRTNRSFSTKIAAGCLALMLSIAIVPLARAQNPIVIKFSHVLSPDSPKGRAAGFFKMRAEDLTKRRVKIEIYHNAQLFKDSDELVALQRGDVQMLAPSLSKFSPLGVREFEVFDVPYIFPNRAALKRVQEGAVGRSLMQKLEPHGVLGLAFWDNRFKIMSANRPLAVPTDMRGMRLRIQGSQVLDAQMRAVGGLPQVFALSDVLRALRAQEIDGTENPPSNMYSQRIHEAQQFAVDTNHGYLGYALIANKQFWDGLPADIRAALDQAVREATRFANTIAWQDNADALAVIEHSGKTKVVHLSDAQRKAWQQALAPVMKNAEQRVGAELLKTIVRETSASTN